MHGSCPAHRFYAPVARAIAKLRGDRRASVAVEFALIGVLCIELVLETMQAGLYFYASASLEKATYKAGRQIMTGAVASAGLTASQFRSNTLCPNLPSTMACANIVTNINTVSPGNAPNGGFYQYVRSDLSGVTTPAMDNSSTSFSPGAGGSVIYVQVFYAMPVISPVWRAVGSTNWNGTLVHFVSSAVAFKNEPFNGGTS